jgi:hypothetical protein
MKSNEKENITKKLRNNVIISIKKRIKIFRASIRK